jgi:hypothetical protein
MDTHLGIRDVDVGQIHGCIDGFRGDLVANSAHGPFKAMKGVADVKASPNRGLRGIAYMPEQMHFAIGVPLKRTTEEMHSKIPEKKVAVMRHIR